MTDFGTDERLDAIEHNLRRVLERLGMEWSAGRRYASDAAGPVIDDEVSALIRSGKKIEAIRIVRERTGLGLAEAKDLVDRSGA